MNVIRYALFALLLLASGCSIQANITSSGTLLKVPASDSGSPAVLAPSLSFSLKSGLSPSSKSLNTAITVSGAQVGNILNVYTDSTCSTLWSSQTIGSTSNFDLNFKVGYGNHTFYSTLTGTGFGTTACSLTGVSYTADVATSPGFPLGSQDAFFVQAQGITKDKFGNIWISDYGNRLLKFNAAGVLQFSVGTNATLYSAMDRPEGVAADSNGNIYLLNTYMRKVDKFDQNGTFLSSFGSLGSGNGQFSNPRGLFIDSSDNIYVGDYGNSRIQKFDLNGNFLMKFGSNGSGNGLLNLARGVAVDSTGNIYVADTGNNRIQKFDASGNYLSQFGTTGSGNGQFSNPYRLSLDGAGNIYVADLGNNRIQKFDSSGNYISQIAVPSPLAVHSDSAGNLMVCGDNGSTLKFYNSSGVLQKSIGNYGTANGQFSYVSGMDIDAAGNIWVSAGTSLHKFSSTGVFITRFDFPYGTSPGQFQSINGVKIHPTTGDIYTLESSYPYRIQKFNSSGVYQMDFGDGTLNMARSFAMDSVGNIYVADGGNNVVRKYNSSGVQQFQFGSSGTGDGQFSTPRAIAVDAGGNIYVSDNMGSPRIQKFNSTGTFLMKFGSSGSGNGQFSYWPMGIAVSPVNGDIYVADGGLNNRIQKFNSAGAYQWQVGGDGSGLGQFMNYNSSGLGDLVLDSSGNVFAVDSSNNRIQKFTSAGVPLTN